MMSGISKPTIQSFMRHASLIAENKIFFNKDFLKKFNVMDRCFELSRQFLGNDFNYLHDAVSVRLYLYDVFGPKSLSLFEDAYGEIQLDIEHALLFYYKLKSMNSPLLNVALGVVYFIAGHQLDDEFSQISKVAPKSRITPAFELSEKLFRWKRCPFVLRKYMLPLSKPEGYNAFYYEKHALGQIAYLMNTGLSFEEADKMMKNASGGIFYSYLPVHIENMMLPNILTGGFDPTQMDGLYAQNFVRDTSKIAQSYTVDAVYNVYNFFVKPIMVDVMGMILNKMNEDTLKNTYFIPSDMIVYHLSPHRLGVLVKEGVALNQVLPTLHQFFKPVTSIDLTQVINGEFLW